MKSRIKILCSVILIFAIMLASTNFAYASPPFKINAKSSILIDAKSGKVLYEHNVHDKLPPASITKIMVLLLAMEALDSNAIKLTDSITVSEYAASMGGSQVYLEAGEVNTVDNILKAVAIRSGNDASVALAEHIAGSEELFLKKMNAKAKALGMKNTHFSNVTGFDRDDHYTSAYDISLMSKELLKHKQITKWTNIWMTTIKVGKKHDIDQGLVNTNRLIRFYKGASGLKTGYTSKSGHCLSACATRGELSLISVVLGCSSSNIRFSESKKLLDYGFATYDSVKICDKNNKIDSINITKGKEEKINVYASDDLYALVTKGNKGKIEKKLILPDSLQCPLKKGDKVGELIITMNNKVVGRVDLIIQKDIKKANILDMFEKVFSLITRDIDKK
ncbi:D-alanyl-D-alanine carboxypeptidase [Clostridiaceae bacterium M8S5]|nr:D-alanyl-D-alanine carboxypeptidase [Clostridiaceae bacterium M8S5]